MLEEVGFVGGIRSSSSKGKLEVQAGDVKYVSGDIREKGPG